MFNAPRPAQRYVGPTSNGFTGSFVDENPLSNSVYDDGLDPWSAAPSPTPTPMPQAPASVFTAVIGVLFCFQCSEGRNLACTLQRTQLFHPFTTDPMLRLTQGTQEKHQ